MSKDKRKEYAVNHSLIEKKSIIYIKKSYNLSELINMWSSVNSRIYFRDNY